MGTLLISLSSMKGEDILCYYVAQLLTEKMDLEQVTHSYIREKVQNIVRVTDSVTI